jgi:hypothetical protein
MQDITTFSVAGCNIIAVALNETNPTYIWNIVDNGHLPIPGMAVVGSVEPFLGY